MGRKSHNLTEEQKHERDNRWKMETYWRNVDEYRRKARERYHAKKDRGNIRTEKQN